MACSWTKVELGNTGLQVTPLGLASSYGIDGTQVERAFERGINLFYWGTSRREDFGAGLRRLAVSHRADMVLVIQSYSRVARLMRWSLQRALQQLDTPYADFLLLGWWNQLPPPRIIDAARELQHQGLARHIMISCHHRPTFQKFIQDPVYDGIMVRYNAAHPGAEKEVFPCLGQRKLAVFSYTATSWGMLPNPKYTPTGDKTPTGTDCYRFVLSNPNVQAAWAGAKNGAELDQAMAALDRGPMSDEEQAWMRRVGQAVRPHKSITQRLLG